MRTNQKNEEYYEYTTLKDILMELENSIYYPNVTSSYNNELYLAYSSKGDNSSYYKLLNAQARLLDEDEDGSGSESDEEAVENT